MQPPPDPVTDVKIVSQREKCPAGYFCLEKSVQGHDGQLFDSTWRHKGKRFLCYSKQPGTHVIVDMSVIDEGDPVPQGYTAITNTVDDGDKSFRKHHLCIRVIPKDQATQAIIELALVNKSKGEMPPPAYYTITNEVNDLFICFRMGPVYRPQPPATTGYQGAGYQYSYSSAPHPVGPNRQQWHNQQQAAMPVPWQQQQQQQQQYMPQHGMIAAKPSAQTGIEGLPFKINSKFDILWKKSGHNVAGVPVLSANDIKSKFDYDFTTERTVLPS